MTDGTFQRGTSAAATGFGPTWRMKGGASYRAIGGIELSANVAGRRGYEQLPVFMVEPLAKDGVLPDLGFATFGSIAAPMQWDTEFRVEKKLKTGGPVDVTFVGSAFGSARAIRFGVVLGF
jgi:hypothetical protein